MLKSVDIYKTCVIMVHESGVVPEKQTNTKDNDGKTNTQPTKRHNQCTMASC